MAKHEERAIAFCRELRDRYLERMAEEPWLLESAGKYDVSRQLPGEVQGPQVTASAPRLLPAAA